HSDLSTVAARPHVARLLSPVCVLLSVPRNFVLSSFLFSCSGAHQHLHSFPTRRSSDLNLCDHVKSDCPGSGKNQGIPPVAHGLRSEEHTSELQSRFDLVCRLLLEKKKK